MVKMKFTMMQIAAYQPHVRIGIAFEPEHDRKATAVVKDVLKIAWAARPQASFSTLWRVASS